MADPSASTTATHASDTIDPTQAQTPWLTRSRINILIVVILLAQLLLPLRYYLGFAEGDDERFSWRMFSTVRLQRCEMTISDEHVGSDVKLPVQLKPILQVAWISVLQRYRPSVVEAFLRFRCEGEGMAAAHYERRCVAPDGTSVPPNVLEMDCASGEMREEQQP
jgi:hypothetical protein